MMAPERLEALPDRLMAGISGGADSVALLLMLVQAGKQVTAIHVNHGLRGDASDGDERFVDELCSRLQVPLRIYRAVPPQAPGEGWAREARYAFFRQAAEETGLDAIALAHHRDDQAETLLLHLLRGSGLTGLTAMHAQTDLNGLHILRPLLDCTREELREYLRANAQPWREDASNENPAYLRNGLRHEVIPMLERLAPGVSMRLARTAQILSEDEAALQALTAAFLQEHGGGRALAIKPLMHEPEGMRRRILRAWWSQCVPPGKERTLSAMQTQALTDLLGAPAGSRGNLPGGWHAQTGWTHLHLIPPGSPPQMAEMPAAGCPLFRLAPYAGDPGDGRHAQAIPASWLQEAVIRTRRAGDWLRPFGSAGRQSLQDYFTNRRVDAPFRDQVPLLCRGSEVLLAGGVGAGQIPTAEEMKEPVLLIWNEAFPWLQDDGRD